MIYEGFVMGESDCLHEYEEVKRMINQNEVFIKKFQI